jgi:hypothetical protein
MRAQKNKQDKCIYVKKNEEKRLSHTCALKNYIEKKNRTDSSLFVPMRSRKKRRKKVKKNDHALPIKKMDNTAYYRCARNREREIYIHIQEECE